eukprot:3636318-Pleurochrysis_carterae.AAC.1
MYTWRYRGASCAAPPGMPPARCLSARRAAQRATAGGYGCCSSKRRCFHCTQAATSVDTRSNRLGAKALPNPIRLSTITPAFPSASHHTKHCVHRSARCTGQNL